MRKLPRRLPSNSPSLAWVGFAVLLLALGGGLAGLYTHRQNQEGAKLRLIKELQREVDRQRNRVAAIQDTIERRQQPGELQVTMKQHKFDLRPFTPDRRILITVDVPPAPPASATAVPETKAAAPSVMAVVGRP